MRRRGAAADCRGMRRYGETGREKGTETLSLSERGWKTISLTGGRRRGREEAATSIYFITLSYQLGAR